MGLNCSVQLTIMTKYRTTCGPGGDDFCISINFHYIFIILSNDTKIINNNNNELKYLPVINSACSSTLVCSEIRIIYNFSMQDKYTCITIKILVQIGMLTVELTALHCSYTLFKVLFQTAFEINQLAHCIKSSKFIYLLNYDNVLKVDISEILFRYCGIDVHVIDWSRGDAVRYLGTKADV